MPRKRFSVKEINQLVAFAAHVLKYTPIQISRPEPPPLAQITRTEKVQDALASILVDGTRGEMYAIGTHIDTRTPEGPVTIIVASSHDLAVSKRKYIREVWELVRNMSNHYRHGGEDEYYRTYHKLIRKVYSHCFKKFKKRVLKGYDFVMKLAESDECDDFLSELTKEVENELLFLFDMVENIGAKLEKWTVQDFVNDNRMLTKTMETFYQIVEKRKPILNRFDLLCTKLKLPSIRKYMDKMTALHHSIRVLERSAGAPGLHRALQRKLIVRRLTTESVIVRSPTPQACHTLFHTVSQHDPKDTKLMIHNQISRVRARHLTVKKRYPVHPECRLLDYFSTRPFGSPTMNYIGISKKPCLACFAAFKAWNMTHSYGTFLCRDPQVKWYPWAFPSDLGERGKASSDLVDETYKHILHEVCSDWSSLSCCYCTSRTTTPGFKQK